MRLRRPLLVLAAVVAAVPSPARAIVHMWDIAEIYSSADGSVQYVEFFTTGDNEVGWSGAAIRSIANDSTIAFDTNLEGPTGNRSVLVATPGFADLPGAVVPDFEIPAGFVATAGDTLVFTGGVDRLTFDPGQLPTDGAQSLFRTLTIPSPSLPEVAGPEDLFVGENSPTNYAGETGHLVPEPGAVALGLASLCALAGWRVGDRRAGAPE